MKQKAKIIAAFPVLAIMLMLVACNAGCDRVERFAKASPGSGGNIAIPGYEKLTFAAGSTAQAVNLINPAENNCTFVLSLILDEDDETLWRGAAISPGEEFIRIILNKALEAGDYPVTLHYDCYNIEDRMPLNGAEIQLTLEVK